MRDDDLRQFVLLVFCAFFAEIVGKDVCINCGLGIISQLIHSVGGQYDGVERIVRALFIGLILGITSVEVDHLIMEQFVIFEIGGCHIAEYIVGTRAVAEVNYNLRRIISITEGYALRPVATIVDESYIFVPSLCSWLF